MSHSRIDTAAIRAAYTISAVVGETVSLRREGGDAKGLCPFHHEDTPSFTVNDSKGFFHCFGCGAHGDVIDFVAKVNGLDFKDAADALGRKAGLITGPPPTGARKSAPKPLALVPPPAAPPAADEDSPKHAAIVPVPETASAATFRHHKRGEPARTWEYRDAAGALIGYVCRFEFVGPDQKTHKDILPRCYTAAGWKWVSFPKPRPLYRLDKLAELPAANVVIAEGEKAADAAQILFPQAVAVSWPGGGKAVKHTDWTPLRGRKVVIVPDRDEPGESAALAIAAALDGVAAGIRIAAPPDGPPNGWDLADAVAEGWTAERALTWLQGALRAPSQLRQAAAAPLVEEEPPLPLDDGGSFMGGDDSRPTFDTASAPFQCLGHDHGDYFYLSRGAKQVLRLSGAGHTKSSLLMLAPLQWWETEYATKKGADWDMAANALIRLSERAGIYDPMRVRGRGAWWDDGHPVLHLGDRLVSGGAERDVCGLPSRYIYEAAPPLRVNTGNPLKAEEAVQLVELCKLLSWERPIHAQLLAGWCVIAPICGALHWRPHIWMTGPAGSGKSWVYEHILSRCLGDIALAAASETTEAGLRQALGSDARPVIFDEAEGETAKAQSRIQNVMALMRQASSETSAAIFKGTTSGEGAVYRPRSCFAFASIGVGVQQHADQTRVTVLTLVIDGRQSRADRAAQFARIQAKWHETLTPAFVERLHARTVSMIPVIRKNAETFAVAGAAVMGTRRLGDQLGALVAGVFALHSSREISLADAQAWLQRQDWTDESQSQEERDEVACLRTIMQHVLPVQVPNGHSSTARHDRSVGELIAIASGGTNDGHIQIGVARDTLLRHGIRIDDQEARAQFANTHTGLARILANTSWSKNWGRILKRIDGAVAGGPVRFGGAPDRVTELPIYRLFGE